MNRKSFMRTLGLGAVAALLPWKVKAETPKGPFLTTHYLEDPRTSAELCLPQGLPYSEVMNLRERIIEANSDSEYVIVVNYPLEWVFDVAQYYELSMDGVVVYSADSVPASEVMALREQIEYVKDTTGKKPLFVCIPFITTAELMKEKEKFDERYIVVNYNVEPSFAAYES